MKKIFITICSVFIIALLPFTMATGQEKKSELKIKIVSSDDSGAKIIIDTLIKDNEMPESIKLRDGNVIFIARPSDERDFKAHKNNKYVFINASSGDRTSKNITREIIISKSDSANCTEAGDNDIIYLYSDSNADKIDKDGNHKTISWSEKKEDGSGEKIIYVKKGRDRENNSEKAYKVWVPRNDNDSEAERSRYVIAKDGLVVTVEGNDEAKAKALVKDIEKKLGVKKKDSGKKKTDKKATKKTNKE